MDDPNDVFVYGSLCTIFVAFGVFFGTQISMMKAEEKEKERKKEWNKRKKQEKKEKKRSKNDEEDKDDFWT